ncbi:hypothetical protein L552_3182 [Bordetella pertussis I002]|nr:hypothetical protein L552_3182 [Bordetella pertussis I002]
MAQRGEGAAAKGRAIVGAVTTTTGIDPTKASGAAVPISRLNLDEYNLLTVHS